jgi:hypothetical protein
MLMFPFNKFAIKIGKPNEAGRVGIGIPSYYVIHVLESHMTTL